MTTRRSPASDTGTPDARTGRMKDFVFVAVTVAFFAVSWLYAKSFDRL
ncbi:MAG TPA: hypothetical protein VG319_04980 [Polyangia bacterium]|jgi:hypothetical protein|nr:hypothetical protein [Polyangia bacterium]